MSKHVGSKGKGVYIHQTGEYFNSIGEAANALGVTRDKLSPSKKKSVWLQHLQIDIIPNKRYDSQKRARLKYVYGLDHGEYEKMLIRQNGVCAICGNPETARNKYGIKSLAVDHNHISGKVRGLLCESCNQGIGNLFGDTGTELLKKAIIYLEKV